MPIQLAPTELTELHRVLKLGDNSVVQSYVLPTNLGLDLRYNSNNLRAVRFTLIYTD